MTIRKVLVLSVALLIATPTLYAVQAKPVDLTGVWTGTFTPSTGDPGTAHIDLTQKGADLTGTAGPRSDRQSPIANGKVTTLKGVTSVTFDTTQPNGLVMKFSLKLVDGRLKGPVTGDMNGEKREAVVDVGRAK
jgi:hypothetical protein